MAMAPPQPGWGEVIRGYAATERTARRLTEQLRACEAAALAFCRLLERWNRGEAVPATPGAREAALRHAADRVETALAGLEHAALALPARARAGAGRGALVVRRARVRESSSSGARSSIGPACMRARTASPPSTSSSPSSCGRSRVSPMPRASTRAPDRSSLWAGLFDLRDTLLGSTVDDLRALAA